jgi:hypothetical protein
MSGTIYNTPTVRVRNETRHLWYTRCNFEVGHIGSNCLAVLD